MIGLGIEGMWKFFIKGCWIFWIGVDKWLGSFGIVYSCFRVLLCEFGRVFLCFSFFEDYVGFGRGG